MFQVFQMFYLDVTLFHLDVAKVDPDVAHVTITIHVCCKCMSQMFQLFLKVCSKCVFQMFHLDVACVSSGCCICCSKYTRMLQFTYFGTYIAVAIHICCKHMFFIFYLVSDICCSICYSPHALTRGHVRAARTQPSLSIFVMPAPIVRRAHNGR
jgi:hypothetical protein